MTADAPSAGTIEPETEASAVSQGRRSVIVHYHIFKNAGSSLDAALRGHFGVGWTTIEADATGVISPDRLASFIASNPDAKVVSSHTAVLPTPVVTGVDIIPVLFLRNPIERAWSIWSYERVQREDTVGSLMARRTTFAEYVAWRIDADNSITDFQTRRLAPAGIGSTPLGRALDALDKLSFVGVVEDYDASLACLTDVLRRSFPDIVLRSFHANKQEGFRPDLQSALGEPLYSRLVTENSADTALWTKAGDLIRERHDQVSNDHPRPS